MRLKNATIIATIILSLSAGAAANTPGEVELKIEKRYLNFPVSGEVDRAKMAFDIGGEKETPVVIRLASEGADYWVFRDMTAHKGKTVKISYEGDADAVRRIYQSDEFAGADSLYRETNRPQFHFTSRRGWNNDPNGLLYHNGEYHLYYQHNPYEREWENMHWGHAASRDLVHWTELDDALRPDEIGTMYSGSAVIDHDNTSGFGKGAMVAFYTAAAPDRQTQCVAWSTDGGRTFTKYDGNPIIDSKEVWNSVDTRDPKVFWYTPEDGEGWWVMVLNERDGHSIYTSTNLREWRYESHTTGFWECPELFELSIDGDPANTLWVMYGASGTYMLGEFDGRKFTPLHGKYIYTRGVIYAAQTYTGMTDGRRVQIGWGRVAHPGMPFNGMMLLPTELTLRTTKDGPRLFSVPARETEQLFTSLNRWGTLSSDDANAALKKYSDKDCLRLKTTIKLSHATSAGLDLDGQRIIDYDLSNNTLNGMFYSPEDMTSTSLTADIYIDRTSIEVFIDGGAYSYSMERRATRRGESGLRFWGNRIEVSGLEVFDVRSIW
jgi:sucrose-6-phosphate hydrolase SacC (GH32 family)